MDRNEVLQRLTDMAAAIVRARQIELALAWLWCTERGEPAPTAPRDLVRELMFVIDHGKQEVEPGYSGRDYFEDCLQLAMRQARRADLLRGYHSLR